MVGRSAGPPEETLPRRRIFVRGGRMRATGGGGGWFRRLVMALLLIVLVMPPLQVAFHRYVPVWITPLQVQRIGQGYGLTRDWTPLEDISPELIRAVIASEDSQFCAHWGFDFHEIRNAFREWQSGEGIRGASTISMQTARNVFLWAGRDPVRKVLEAYMTPWLELGWSKRRIMEVYLNVIEWGPGLYGAEAAAQRYFGKPAAALTRREASLMAAVLPHPLQWSPADPPSHIQRRAGTIHARIPATPRPDAGNDPCPVK